MKSFGVIKKSWLPKHIHLKYLRTFSAEKESTVSSQRGNKRYGDIYNQSKSKDETMWIEEDKDMKTLAFVVLETWILRINNRREQIDSKYGIS